MKDTYKILEFLNDHWQTVAIIQRKKTAEMIFGTLQKDFPESTVKLVDPDGEDLFVQTPRVK